MSDLKTRPTEVNVTSFLNAVEGEARRQDAFELLALMKRVTGKEPRMWGPSMVGFGSYHYRYESGREGDMLVTGFSPRKRELVVYILAGFERYDALMSRLGKHRTGKSCLYLKQLSDVDLKVLEELVSESVRFVRERYETD